MKKNLLLFIFAVLFGVAYASATVIATIEVDNASNVTVTNGTDGPVVTLVNGVNTVSLDETLQPLTIVAANGATIEGVSSDGNVLNPDPTGTYRASISEGMNVVIATQGAPARMISTWFKVDPLGAISVTAEGVKTVIDEEKYYEFPSGSQVIVAGEGNFSITDLDYMDMNDNVVDNGDGTYTVTLAKDYGFIDVKVVEKGIHFTVDVNVASNVSVVANLTKDMIGETAIKQKLDLRGNGPVYECTAPEETYNLQFWEATGGQIYSITRIQPDGTETKLVNSDWVGYASEVAEGDQFIVNAIGPNVELTFAGGRGVTASDFVYFSDGEKIALTEDGTNLKGMARVGSTLNIAGGAGYALTFVVPDQNCVREISCENGLFTGMVLKEGTVYSYASAKTGMSVNVDNAAAVTVTGGAGNGSVLTLQNGENVLETVQNPLKIAANAGYRVVSVCADGEILKANADGTYNAELTENGTIIIITDELPKPLLLTFSVVGDESKLVITKDGEAIPFAQTLEVTSGTEITIGTVEGWLIKDLTATGGNKVELDEETGIYSMVVRKAGSFVINVEEWTAAEGNAMVRYITDMERVSALLFNPDGEREGSLKPGLNEVKIGSTVKLQIWGDRYLDEVKVNGVNIELAEDRKTAEFTIDGETTVEVTTFVLCSVSGYKTSNPENHSFLGYIYINEVGQLTASVPVGETFTVLPTAERGYKFDGFDFIYPEEIAAQIGDEIKDSYTVTVPEGVTSIIFSGKFVLSGEAQLYTIRGGNTFLNTIDNITNDVYVYVNISEPGDTPVPAYEYNAFEGETVHLMATAVSNNFEIVSYCLYYSQKLISADYVVNGEDADAFDVITVSAFVRDASGVEDVAIDGELTYDAATRTLTAPALVKVFTTSGNLVLSAEAGEVSLESLPAGMYIATTGNATIKIVR